MKANPKCPMAFVTRVLRAELFLGNTGPTLVKSWSRQIDDHCVSSLIFIVEIKITWACIGQGKQIELAKKKAENSQASEEKIIEGDCEM